MIRVLIAEDSLTVRDLLEQALGADPQIEVVGLAKNGLEAVEMTKRLRPDVVTMDVKMPVMDGFEATKRIMSEVPTPIVIISATMDMHDVDVSMNALRVGALALLEKPPGVTSPKFDESIWHLVSTVKAMAGVKVVRHWPDASASRRAPAVARQEESQIKIIAMAASTGGPAALARILSELPVGFPVPILVVQHIALGFVDGLVSWLSTRGPLRIKAGENGERLNASTVYLASDDLHMGVTRDARLALVDTPRIGMFRPSATYLFGSVARAYGPAALSVILTGMGEDGVGGLREVRAAGGRIIAQDEASSIVFGMPGAAIAAGLAERVLPLSAIAASLVEMTGKARADNK
ncbi:chemotaxis protein CheB [soil metagenome]